MSEFIHDIEWHKEHKRLGFYDPIAELAEELEKIQLSKKDATFDCISRQAAIAEFSCCELTPDGGIDANYAIDFLAQMPSAQPEIIRCKDCIEWDSDSEWCNRHGGTMQENDFCSRAERRTDG